MRTLWNNVWKFETARFAVSLDWEYEESPDLSWDETGETQDKIESGEWGCFTFRVRVTCDGREVGTDYLGNSIYADPKEFRDHLGLAAKCRADGRRYGSYFSDMVGNAILETRRALCDVPRLRCA
jgi:hypothetical protein